MKRMPALVPLLLLVTACDSPGGEARAARPSGGTAAPGTTVTRGQATVDCGTFVLGQGEDLADSAARCFVDAVAAGRPARLKVTRPTVEGQPIPITYTAGAGGRTQVLVDHRQDGYSTPALYRQTCWGPSAGEHGIDFERCTPLTPVTK
ncbi:DUF4362 domain-containing protein [Actinoplanes sp. URMC 104]|uniref:DUF4362 domain-containing protein n=1 Tax=Actinoplanes sp. URMC 104 TaxID=3423409 RepID=UPI003F1A5EB3